MSNERPSADCTVLVYEYGRHHDAGKRTTEVVIRGECTGLRKGRIGRSCSFPGDYFVPEQVGLPSLTPDLSDWQKFATKRWPTTHKLVQIESRHARPHYDFHVDELVQRFDTAAREGWNKRNVLETFNDQQIAQLFQKAVDGGVMKLASRVLFIAEDDNLHLDPEVGVKLFRHYRQQEGYRALGVLGHLPEIAAYLRQEERLWLLQAPGAEVRTRVLRILGTHPPDRSTRSEPGPEQPVR